MSKDLEKAEASEIIGPSTETMNEQIDLNQDLELGQAETEEHAQVECRICQEEDFIDKLEAPCLCNGTLKFAHRDCIQRWINERLSMICEICKQPYQPEYTTVLPPTQDVLAEDVTISIRDGDGYFTFNTNPVVAAGQAQRAAQLEAAAAAEYMRRLQAYNARAFSGSAVCRIGAVICLTFLVARDVDYFIQNGDGSDLFIIFCVILGFFIPCYLLAWFGKAFNQHAEDLAASEVAVASQSRLTGPDPDFTPKPEPGPVVNRHHRNVGPTNKIKPKINQFSPRAQDFYRKFGRVSPVELTFPIFKPV